MSYMSMFDQSTRNYTAISILNKLRHWLQGRGDNGLKESERHVLCEALEIVTSERFDKMVIHSLQSAGDNNSSSVLAISSALHKVLTSKDNNMSLSDMLQLEYPMSNIVNSNVLSETPATITKCITLLNEMIEVIGQQSQYSLNSSLHYKGI
jgi:hypothetical protein